MPQTYGSLRRKFMKDGSDGIGEAITILENGGCTISEGVITVPEELDLSKQTFGEIKDALTYLVQEWDYSNG